MFAGLPSHVLCLHFRQVGGGASMQHDSRPTLVATAASLCCRHTVDYMDYFSFRSHESQFINTSSLLRQGSPEREEGGCRRVLRTPACPGQALCCRLLVTATLDTHPYVSSRYITVKVNNQPISGRLKHLPRNASQTPSPEMLHRRGGALLAASCLRHILSTIQAPDAVQFDNLAARDGSLRSKHLLRLN